MAWLAAIGGGAGAGAGAASAAGAGTASAVGTGAAEGAATAGAAEGASSGMSALADSAKDSLISSAANKVTDEVQSTNEPTKNNNVFSGAQISSSANLKTNTQDVSSGGLKKAEFSDHSYKKPDTTSEIGKASKNLISGAESLISSSEELKTDTTDVSDNKTEEKKGSASMLNEKLKEMGERVVDGLASSAASSQPFQPVQPGFTGNTISSDEELKTDIKDAGGLVPLFSTIDSYLYKYKNSAQDKYAGTGMVNDDNNLGVMAQELQENPLTEPAVKTDEKGNLALDTGRLTSINTAMIAELCKKVQAIEEQMYGRAQ